MRIPGLRTPTAREYLCRIMLEDFSQLVRVIAFCSGTFCSREDNQEFVKVSGQTRFCMCDEVMAYALRYDTPVEGISQIM